MSSLTIDDVNKTIEHHNIYVKKIDSLLSFDNGELTIYKSLSKFKKIEEYEIPIYKNQKSTTNYKVYGSGVIKIKVDEFIGKKMVDIEFDNKDPDNIKITTKDSKSATFKVVYIAKEETGNYKRVEKDTNQEERISQKKYKLRELSKNYIIYLTSYYILMSIIFFAMLSLAPFLSDISTKFTILVTLILTVMTHFKTKDMFLFFIDKHIDKINNFIYR